MAMYHNGHEVAWAIFNTEGTDKFNWINSNTPLIDGHWEDIKGITFSEYCSVEGLVYNSSSSSI